MVNAVEFTTTESEIVIRLDRTNVNNRALEEITSYLRPFLAPIPSEYVRALSAKELRRLPKEQRDAIIREQVALLVNDENIEDDQDLMEEDV
jgi:hypothetical protein